MAQYQTTIEVPAAPHAAFAYLADFSNTKEWDPSIVEAERIGDGPVGPGSQFRLVVAFFGRRIELTYTVERHESPSTVVLVGKGKSVESRDTITVEPATDGSRVTYDARLRLKGAMRLLDKGMQLQFTTMSERATAGLEAKLATL
jgi:carbon monoxide dehydrogenase subunit G